MPFTRGAHEVPNQTPASSSDARKRQAERDEEHVIGLDGRCDACEPTDLPPTLPDTSGWVKRVPGDVIEAGTPYVARDAGATTGGPLVQWKPDGRTYAWTVERYHMTIWTPPPAEPAPSEPWRVISTDRDQPTLARVIRGSGAPLIDLWHFDGDHLRSETWSLVKADVTHVELLHTHDPVTQVPIERALIDEAAAWIAWWNEDDSSIARPDGVRTSDSILAALADGDAIERAAEEAITDEIHNRLDEFVSWAEDTDDAGGYHVLNDVPVSEVAMVARAALHAANLLASPVREPGRSEAEIKESE